MPPAVKFVRIARIRVMDVILCVCVVVEVFGVVRARIQGKSWARARS